MTADPKAKCTGKKELRRKTERRQWNRNTQPPQHPRTTTWPQERRRPCQFQAVWSNKCPWVLLLFPSPQNKVLIGWGSILSADIWAFLWNTVVKACTLCCCQSMHIVLLSKHEHWKLQLFSVVKAWTLEVAAVLCLCICLSFFPTRWCMLLVVSPFPGSWWALCSNFGLLIHWKATVSLLGSIQYAHLCGSELELLMRFQVWLLFLRMQIWMLMSVSKCHS